MGTPNRSLANSTGSATGTTFLASARTAWRTSSFGSASGGRGGGVVVRTWPSAVRTRTECSAGAQPTWASVNTSNGSKGARWALNTGDLRGRDGQTLAELCLNTPLAADGRTGWRAFHALSRCTKVTIMDGSGSTARSTRQTPVAHSRPSTSASRWMPPLRRSEDGRVLGDAGARRGGDDREFLTVWSTRGPRHRKRVGRPFPTP